MDLAYPLRLIRYTSRTRDLYSNDSRGKRLYNVRNRFRRENNGDTRDLTRLKHESEVQGLLKQTLK